MLKRTCQQFREGFEPRRPIDDPHPLDCPACAAWARRLEDTFRTAPPSPLPQTLARRLQAIPQKVVLCRDLERLYAEARRRAAARKITAENTVPDLAVTEHLADCRRCQRLYGVLESVLLEPPQPLPKRLVPRLRALSRLPSWTPPRWLRDARYAAAACFLFAASLTFVVEDAAAAFQEAKSSMAATTAVLTETVRVKAGEARGQAIWKGVTESLEEIYLDGRHRGFDLESSWREFTNETLRELEAMSQRLSQQDDHNEGESNG